MERPAPRQAPVPEFPTSLAFSASGLDVGLSLPCGRISNFAKTPFRIRMENQENENPYKNGAVASFPPEGARNLGFQGRLRRQESVGK